MFLAILSVCGCEKIEKQAPKETDETVAEEKSTWIENYDLDETGILVKIDEEQQKFTIKRIDSGEKLEFEYRNATNVTDKYNSLLTINQVDLGELVNVYYNGDDNIARKLEKSPEAWEYTQVTDLTYDRPECIINIGGTKYKYGASFTVISDGEEIDLLDLSPIDEVTVKGYGKKVCSVIVTKGHGYISLKNDEDFWGGWVEIGTESAKPVKDGMMITASEGTHKLSIVNNKQGGSKSIVVRRHQETVVDVGDLKGETIKSGSLQFNIKPEGAKLFINGTSVDYSELVVLEYGSYKITVSADGYDDYSQVIVVGSNLSEIEIDLTGQKDSDSKSDTKSDTKSDSSTDSNSNKDTTTDNKDTNTSTDQKTDSEKDSKVDGLPSTDTDNSSDSDSDKKVMDEEEISNMIDELLDGVISTNLDAE